MSQNFPFTQFISIQKARSENTAKPDSQYIPEIPKISTDLNPDLPCPNNNKEEVPLAEEPQQTQGHIQTVNTEPSKSSLEKTFENYIVGSSSQMAYRTLFTAAQSPGLAVPAIFLHSVPGNGKGHLVAAFIQKTQSLFPRLNIASCTTKNFVNQITDIYSNEKDKNSISRKITELKNKYTKECDILILEDIHELKNKTGTQNLFLQIFNELFDQKKQIILTSDLYIHDLDGIDPRLISKLNLCLVVSISKPDFDTRLSYIKIRSSELDIYLPFDVILYIANNITDSIRSLENALSQLNLYSSLMATDIDLEITKTQLHLGSNSTHNKYTVEFESILSSVSKHYGITNLDILSNTRKKNFSMARHVAMYLSHKLLGLTFSDIGSLFGNRNHTSVIYAIDKIKKIENSKNHDFDAIKKILTSYKNPNC